MRCRVVLGILLVLMFATAFDAIGTDDSCFSSDASVGRAMNVAPLVARPGAPDAPLFAALNFTAPWRTSTTFKEVAVPRTTVSFGRLLPSIDSLALLFHVFRI